MSRSLALRLTAGVVIGAVVLFCAYGFLATFEPGDHMAFRIGYAIVGIVGIGAIIWLLLPRAPRAD